MAILEFNVQGQHIKCVKPYVIVSDTLAYLTISVAFDGDGWDECDKKYIHFTDGTNTYESEITDGVVFNAGSGEWECYVHGATYDGTTLTKRITTDSCILRVATSNILDGDEFPSIDPSIKDQLIASIGTKFGAVTYANNLLTFYDKAGGTALGSVTIAGGGSSYDDTELRNRITAIENQESAWTGKQDAISDLAEIRSGASKGATALQSVPSTYRTSADQDVIDEELREDLASKQDVLTDSDKQAIADMHQDPTVEQVLTEGTEIAKIGDTSLFAPNGGGNDLITLIDETLTENVASISYAGSDKFKRFIIAFNGRCNIADDSITTGDAKIYMRFKSDTGSEANNNVIWYAISYMRTSGAFPFIIDTHCISEHQSYSIVAKGNAESAYNPQNLSYAGIIPHYDNLDYPYGFSLKIDYTNGKFMNGSTVKVYGEKYK